MLMETPPFLVKIGDGRPKDPSGSVTSPRAKLNSIAVEAVGLVGNADHRSTVLPRRSIALSTNPQPSNSVTAPPSKSVLTLTHTNEEAAARLGCASRPDLGRRRVDLPLRRQAKGDRHRHKPARGRRNTAQPRTAAPSQVATASRPGAAATRAAAVALHHHALHLGSRRPCIAAPYTPSAPTTSPAQPRPASPKRRSRLSRHFHLPIFTLPQRQVSRFDHPHLFGAIAGW